MVKIGTKLGIGIGVMVVLCVSIGLISYQQTQLVGEKLQELAEIREPANSAVYALENHLVETAFAAFGYSATGDSKFVDAYDRGIADPNFLTRTIPGGSSPLSSDDVTLRRTFEQLHAGAVQNMDLRNRFSRTMDSLEVETEALDRLLVDRIQWAVREDDPVAYRRLQVALGMQIQLNTVTKQLGNFLQTGEPRYGERMDDGERKLHEFARAYQVLLLKPEERNWADELQRRLSRVLALASKLRALEKERRERLTAFLALYRDLKVQLDEGVKTGTERGLEKAREELLSAGQTANTTILLALLASVVFGVGAGIMTTQRITRPLEDLTEVMRDIAGGNTRRRVNISTNDELRLVGEAFNNMTDQLESAEQARLTSLRTSAASMQRAQEEERARISRELHDDVCQRLTGTRYRVEVLQDGVPHGNRRMSRELEEVSEELDRSINEVRRISSNLRPSVLDDFGLVAALRLLCSELHRSAGLMVACAVPDGADDHVDRTTEIALYRIAQEALTNIGKHAKATQVQLDLTRVDAGVRLRVHDDGIGFSQADLEASRRAGHGFGLRTMSERAELLGGRYEVDSSKEGGTTVTVTLPLPEENDNA
jgi:two-component system, NarL family, sensor histidine kinase UhpB